MQAPVRYWTQGTAEYRSAGSFPIPGTEPVRFYPASAESGAAVHRLTKIGSNRWAGVPLDAVGRLASTRLRTRC